jgi:hypothetical protein
MHCQSTVFVGAEGRGAVPVSALASRGEKNGPNQITRSSALIMSAAFSPNKKEATIKKGAT